MDVEKTMQLTLESQVNFEVRMRKATDCRLQSLLDSLDRGSNGGSLRR